MSSSYNQNLWNMVLSELQQQVPKKHYDYCFKTTTLVSCSKEVITIFVPNEIIQARVSSYLEEIQKAVFKHYGDSPKIEFTNDAGDNQQTFFNFEESIEKWEEDKPLQKIDARDAAEESHRNLNLNSLYTFENFVVGPSNQLSHAAAFAVANKPGKVYNPLFMYGAVGLGKTHLLHAICHEVIKQKCGYIVEYLSCEEFINRFITSVEKGDLEGFRRRFRHVDILLIDDVHFLANKERTQEEFFHTFNALYNSEKQIILSSDSSPIEIPQLKERVVSRFKWGLVSHIDTPTYETRVAIVKKKSRLKGMEFGDAVCQYIAENIVSNIRELEGAINYLIATASTRQQEITPDYTKIVLQEVITLYEPVIQIPEIISVVAKHFNIKTTELQSKKRNKTVVVPRQIAMFLAKKLTSHSLQEIGASFGGRDHSTVLHALEKVKQTKEQDKELQELLIGFEHEIFANKKF